jgi:hypothetical protein
MTCIDFIIVSIFVTSHKDAATVAFVGVFAIAKFVQKRQEKQLWLLPCET